MIKKFIKPLLTKTKDELIDIILEERKEHNKELDEKSDFYKRFLKDIYKSDMEEENKKLKIEIEQSRRRRCFYCKKWFVLCNEHREYCSDKCKSHGRILLSKIRYQKEKINESENKNV